MPKIQFQSIHKKNLEELAPDPPGGGMLIGMPSTSTVSFKFLPPHVDVVP